MKFYNIILWIFKILIVILVFSVLFFFSPFEADDQKRFLLFSYMCPGLVIYMSIYDLICDIPYFLGFCMIFYSMESDEYFAFRISFIFYVILSFILFKIFKKIKNKKLDQ